MQNANRKVVALAAATAVVGLLIRHRRPRTLWWQRTLWWWQQRWLRRFLVEADMIDLAKVQRVGGVDISFVKDSETEACAALVVIDADTLEVVSSQFRHVQLTAPYIPGYLAFREVGFLLTLIDDLRTTAPELLPDVILVDGNGILHPNRFGLACHLGVLSGIPTVGVGKSLHHIDGLTKNTLRELTSTLTQRGAHTALVGDSGAVWGALLRTSEPAAAATTCRPVVVSVGHGLGLDSALELVRRMVVHRIPEPIRRADLGSRDWLRQHGGEG